MKNENITIAAIATAFGEGGIAIIRISGDEAITIADKVYRGQRKLVDVDSHTINYGKLINSEGLVIDEALVSVFHGPKSYTGEDLVEINSHGGAMPARRALDLVLAAGAFLAQPGEFTKRAFLNGRIDLTQAEAVIDLIRSKTELSSQAAINQLSGVLSEKVRGLRQLLIELLAHIEVTIDYPEHDVEDVTRQEIRDRISQVMIGLEELLSRADEGKILREGIKVALVGKPNVGKSSLLNAMLEENRAIVTDIPGTTRDILEEYINIRGIAVRLIDTAGIRETEDIIEQIGIEKSKEAIDQADLVLLILDGGQDLDDYDYELLDLMKDKQGLVVINKRDLDQVLDEDDLRGKLEESSSSVDSIIKISTVDSSGIASLYDAIEEIFISDSISQADASFLTNNRQIDLLRRAKASLAEVNASLDLGLPVDILAIDISISWEIMGEIIGDTASEGLLDQLFSQFCLGK